MNLTPLLKTIWNTYSEKLAYQHVLSISRFHRIQASQGYRDSASFVESELKLAGIDAWIESYPANQQASFWATSSFEEWSAEQGILTLLEPAEQAAVLADYRAMPISLIQRSISFEGTAEVVLLEEGVKESDYTGLDVKGKIVLTKGNLDKVRRLAVEKHGAIGILYDGMTTLPGLREPMDLPDTLQYTSFWWKYYPGEKKCFGFVLSPRQGNHLRQDLLAKKPVKVAVNIKSRLFDGNLDNVVGLIPGKTKEEVIVTAHLCHPQPSANDNASGSAAILETACTLQRLITQGVLPQPERSIRFLWIPEMSGTSAYLATHEAEIPQMVAGINLDMVGEDQNKTGSCFCFINPPQALSSFVPTLLESVLMNLFQVSGEHQNLDPVPGFRYAITGFSGGSDHYIYSDPTVGVPMPMLNQFPDRFYHTSSDTPDQLDPKMLRRSGTIAAAFAYWIANADHNDTLWLAHEMQTHFNIEINRRLQGEYNRLDSNLQIGCYEKASGWLNKHANHALQCHFQALSSLEKLSPAISPTLQTLKEKAARQVKEIFDHYCSALTTLVFQTSPSVADSPWEEKAAALIPVRLYRGPASFDHLAAKLPEAERTAWEQLMSTHPMAYELTSLAEYWADGKRTGLEIIDLIELECGRRDAEFVVATFELLKKFNLVRFS